LHVCPLEQKNLMNWEFTEFSHLAVSQPSIFVRLDISWED
jgi:hypothetical protein